MRGVVDARRCTALVALLTDLVGHFDELERLPGRREQDRRFLGFLLGKLAAPPPYTADDAEEQRENEDADGDSKVECDLLIVLGSALLVFL